MRWHRNIWTEYSNMIAAYVDIDHDWSLLDITTFEQTKKIKFNRLLSFIKWCVKHTPEFKSILAYVPWNVQFMSFRYIDEDIGNIFEYMRQNSGTCYIAKVIYKENYKTAVRFIPIESKIPNDIHATVVKYLGLEEYEIGRCYSQKKYW